jgi:hypothetical protein
MTSLDLTRLGRTPQCLGRYVEDARGVRKIEPRLNTIHGGLEDRDTMVRTQRGDTFASPTIAVASFESVAIEKASDQIVVRNQCQLAYGRDDVSGGAAALTASAPGQTDLAVNAA